MDKLCAPGDEQQAPRWILRFADNEIRDMHFDNEEEAHARWQFHCGPSGSYNGRLYETSQQKPPIPHDEMERLVYRRAQIEGEG